MKVRYLTHPQVQIDPAIPVPAWGLSTFGKQRIERLLAAPWLEAVTRIVTSSEHKAIETAAPIAAKFKLNMEIREAMHENDRSSTGFLPPNEFEIAADEFFARPETSIRGWERAEDAQARIVREVESVLGERTDGDILFVGHGAVGTLLYCRYAKCRISRKHDQPAGGGCIFSFLKEDRRLLHAWTRLEETL